MRELRSQAALDEVWQQPQFVLFKHSTQCPLSAAAFKELQEFARLHVEVPVFLVRVIESKPLSAEVERRAGVRHESPQALVVRNGAVAWHASHRRITAEGIAEYWLASTGAG